MKNKLDSLLYLNVFNLVCRQGDKRDGYYDYNGLTAWQDFDGYTCFLSDGTVTMTLMFHGRYDIDYPNKDALEFFHKRVQKISLFEQA
ncbi:DUF3081 family protein [Thalassotalea aquiviva]|uniref:DUF3081 family protein n=1 Tax=Thalassotalea aquiviva TaxID=3242415 RepID=UPI00352A1975